MRIVAVGPETRSDAFMFGNLRGLCGRSAALVCLSMQSELLGTCPAAQGWRRPFKRIQHKFLDFTLPDGEFEWDRQDLPGLAEASW
jgi:hypothetical protein